MANKSITITQPTIIAPAYFDVKYRQLPSGSWVGLPHQDNDTFVISGLSAGATYELSVVYVRSDNTRCGETIVDFTVPTTPPPTCACPTITSPTITTCGKSSMLETNISGGVSITQIRVTYTIGGATNSIIYAYNTSAGQSVVIPVPTPPNGGAAPTTTIEGFCSLTSTWLPCYSGNPARGVCECITSQIISGVASNWDGMSATAIIMFNATNTSPLSSQMTLIITQTNTLSPNTITMPITPSITGTDYAIPVDVFPTPDGSGQFVITVISDVCGTVSEIIGH